MAVVVLASSTGFGFVEHSCLMLGKKTFSISEPKTCFADKKDCSKPLEKQPSLRKTKCCKDEQKYENIEYASSILQHFTNFIQNIIVAPVAIKFDFRFIFEAIISTLASFYSSSSPPLSGREILVFIQTFLI